jgi:tetratricopeptide (TPR) repeat protein
VARGTQHRKRRPTANAQPVARTGPVASPKKPKQKPPQWQEELFFSRLRVHAKWMFVFLAVVFGAGFVFLGVGSGSTGISDALQNAFHFGSGGGSSISSLQKKTQKHPKDAQAWRDLATALEAKQRTSEAVSALEQYTTLKPKDESGLAELAAQYGDLAQQYATDYQNAQSASSSASLPAAAFAPSSTSPFGKALTDPKVLQDPLSSAVQGTSQTTLQTALSSYQDAQQKAEAAYKKIVALNPKDATSQVQLGQSAQAAGDTKTAIKAFEAFLKLAPTDPLAPQVKQALKSLKPTPKPAKSTSG